MTVVPFYSFWILELAVMSDLMKALSAYQENPLSTYFSRLFLFSSLNDHVIVIFHL